MFTELSERFEQAAGPVERGPDIDAALRRGSRLRRRRQLGAGIGSLCLVLAAIGGAAMLVGQPAGPELGPIGEPDDARAVLQQPAASDPALWPLRLVYELQYPAGYFDATDPGGVARYEFVGTSWNNWQVTQLEGSQTGEIVDRKRGNIDHFADGEDDTVGQRRVPGRDLSPNWHESGWSLQPVDLDAIPSSADVIERLGLAPGDVRAFASPAVVECRQDAIEDCPQTGSESVRALMHLDSGLLLYRQTVHDDEPMFTYVVSELSFANSNAIPQHGPAG